MSQARYPHLLAPGRIGTMELRNRIVVMAMGVSLAEEDGTVGDRALAYHEEQAKGGAGLIISGATGVAWPVAAVQKNQLAISDDRFIPGLRRLAEAIHAHGAKFGVQLHQGGLVAAYSLRWGHPLWCPSLPHFDMNDEQITDAFVESELQAAAAAPRSSSSSRKSRRKTSSSSSSNTRPPRTAPGEPEPTVSRSTLATVTCFRASSTRNTTDGRTNTAVRWRTASVSCSKSSVPFEPPSVPTSPFG